VFECPWTAGAFFLVDAFIEGMTELPLVRLLYPLALAILVARWYVSWSGDRRLHKADISQYVARRSRSRRRCGSGANPAAVRWGCNAFSTRCPIVF